MLTAKEPIGALILHSFGENCNTIMFCVHTDNLRWAQYFLIYTDIPRNSDSIYQPVLHLTPLPLFSVSLVENFLLYYLSKQLMIIS